MDKGLEVYLHMYVDMAHECPLIFMSVGACVDGEEEKNGQLNYVSSRAYIVRC